MSQQIWVRCPKAWAERVKRRLGRHLDRSQKMAGSWDVTGEFLDIPTIFSASPDHRALRIPYAEPGPELPATIVAIVKERIPVEPRRRHPVVMAVKGWLLSLSDQFLHGFSSDHLRALLDRVPTRWVVYHPMVMLPAGSFQDERWETLLNAVKVDSRGQWNELWVGILEAIQKLEGNGKAKGPGDPSKILTHLAVNAGIPLQHKGSHVLTPDKANKHESHGSPGADVVARQNILRSPTGLIMLHGDFGPPLGDAEDLGLPAPTKRDFDDAFWVSTVQNGIYQTWAPRYTMFSRGNIKEKARLLNFHKPDRIDVLEPEVDARRSAVTQAELAKAHAVDLFAGIGYFAFSYVRMGMGRVVCWELNPWSVEGLRRGAAKNGWAVKVLGPSELDEIRCQGKDIRTFLTTADRVVVFPESNGDSYETLTRGYGVGNSPTVLHVNCGLLPSSRRAWENASRILTHDKAQGWLHIHENVAVEEVEGRGREIASEVRKAGTLGIVGRVIRVEHVEFVKSYAPGVWHCVYDVWIGPAGG